MFTFNIGKQNQKDSTEDKALCLFVTYPRLILYGPLTPSEVPLSVVLDVIPECCQVWLKN